jgi:hypothetical protein
MKLSLPQQGQPLDVNYIYQIAREINSLNNQLMQTKTNSVIDNGFQREEMRTNNVRFYAATENVVSASVKANSSQERRVSFDPPFLNTPIVVGSIRNSQNSTAGNNIILTTKNVSAGGAVFELLYNKDGNVNVNIDIIAIGVSG